MRVLPESRVICVQQSVHKRFEHLDGACLNLVQKKVVMITHRLGVMEMPNWRCLALLSAQYTHIIVEKGPKHVQVSYRE
jgi:hypothetical protein